MNPAIAHRISLNDRAPLVHAVALGAFLLAAMPAVTSLAQDLDSEDSAESIVGSEIATDKAEPASVTKDVLAAIDAAAATADEVKTMFRVEDFHIVFLGNRQEAKGAERINAALEEHAEELDALREAIDGSSVFYTALDTNNLDVESVIAATVSDENAATVYVFGEAPE